MKESGSRNSIFLQRGEGLGVSWYRLYLAESLAGRFSGDYRDSDLGKWFLLHLALQSGSGHLRTDLKTVGADMREWYLTGEISGESDESIPDRVAENLPDLVAAGLKSGLIGRLAEENSPATTLSRPRPPLVLSSDGEYLYFLRRRKEEDNLLAGLEIRTRQGYGKNLFDRFHDQFSPDELKGSSGGLILEKLIEGRRLILLAGGPGTGKTTAVTELLDMLADQELELALAAPTGRAAARMGGRTIHGLLGIVPGRPARHNADNPLAADLVVVDEASMVDLQLMNLLLDALPGDVPLVLVGDPDQLPSVEAGALLGDLLHGDAESSEAGRPGPLSGSVVKLSRVYRSDRSVLEAASAVSSGNPEVLHERFRSDDAIRLHTVDGHEGLAGIIATGYREAVGGEFETFGTLNADVAAEVYRRLSTHAVLTPLRRGPWGVPALNNRVSLLLRQTSSPFPGMPIMITRNDPVRKLWNGDRGVLLPRDGRLRACLPGSEGFREYPLAALPGWEPAWVQTIHKSQGSEYDGVTILLPKVAEKLLSREILYTAITRARRAVDLYAEAGTVEAALSRRVIRHSRIRKWAAGG